MVGFIVVAHTSPESQPSALLHPDSVASVSHEDLVAPSWGARLSFRAFVPEKPP